MGKGTIAKEQLEAMKLPELKTLAADMGIDTKELSTKAQYVEAISQTEVEYDEAADGQESQGEPEDQEGQEGQEDQEDQEDREDGVEAEGTLEDNTQKRVVYVGPSLPGGLLTKGKILYGTDKSIADFLTPTLKKYPQAKHLVVPVEKSQRAMQDIKNPRTLLYQYAKELEK
jgi:hypothetical protein